MDYVNADNYEPKCIHKYIHTHAHTYRSNHIYIYIHMRVSLPVSINKGLRMFVNIKGNVAGFHVKSKMAPGFHVSSATGIIDAKWMGVIVDQREDMRRNTHRLNHMHTYTQKLHYTKPRKHFNLYIYIYVY